MNRALLLVFVVLAAGCPGLRRPPPSSQRAAPEASPTSATPSAPSPGASPTPGESGLEGFKRRLAGVRSDYQGFLAKPSDHAAWEGVLNALQDVEDTGFALLETSGEAEVEGLLEELADLRAELSEREP